MERFSTSCLEHGFESCRQHVSDGVAERRQIVASRISIHIGCARGWSGRHGDSAWCPSDLVLSGSHVGWPPSLCGGPPGQRTVPVKDLLEAVDATASWWS
jgi:hypothetical protein